MANSPQEVLDAVFTGTALTTTNGAVVSNANADGVSNTQKGQEVNSRMQVFNGTTWDRVRSAVSAGGAVTMGNIAAVSMMGTGGANMLPILNANTNGDASTGSSFPNVGPMNYNGATYDRVRTPKVFKTVQATASGDTAVWTPTGTKKFRLLRCFFEVTGNATHATGAVVNFALRDATAAIGVAVDVFVPAASLGLGNIFTSGWIDLGNGYISTAADAVLNINLSSALVTGNIRVIAIGCEE